MRKGWSEEVRYRLEGLPRKDVVRFAWLCAVRALPFLGENGHFNYWIETRRQTYLLSVLRAIDVSLINTTRAAADNVAAAAANATNAAFNVAAATAAATASDAARSAASDAVRNATSAARAAVDYSIALADLDVIENNGYKFHSDTAVYGKVWGNFQRALRDIGCDYWADWYAALFEKGFALDDDDIDEIKMRFNAPQGFIEQGAAAVARYVMDIKKYDAARLNETRVLILGDKGAGKTSLSLRLKNPKAKMPKIEASTEGVDVLNWPIPALPDKPDSAVNVHIWDFAGHVITHAAHRCFMSERCLYILLIDGRTEGGHSTEYWLEQIRNYGGAQVPILVLVNIRDSHPVKLRENTLKNTFPSIVGFYQVDIDKGGDALEVFRQLVMEHLRENPLWEKQKISIPMFKAKEALRHRFVQGDEYISRDVFDSIADESCVAPDEREDLLKDLHALGLCLWYNSDEMRDLKMMVLNPSWISHGIYRLINWGEQQGKRILSVKDLPRAFAKDGKHKDDMRRYEGKADFLFKLMHEYQLAFFKDSNRIFVPLLLPADRPAENIPIFQGSEHLHIEYVANQALPPYTVSRVAVSHAPELDEDNSWRHGAILRWEGAEALVEEDERGRSVRVYVQGENQTAYISRLRATLGSIFDDYKSERPKLVYFVHDPNSLTGDGKEEVLEKSLVDSANAGMKTAVGEAVLDPKALLEKYGAPTTTYQIINNFVFGDENHIPQYQSPHIITINIEFQNCSVALQESINSFIHDIREMEAPSKDDIGFATQLERATSRLGKLEKEMPQGDSSPVSEETKRSLKSRGLLEKLEWLGDKLSDRDSKLYEIAEKVQGGIETAQKMAERYNDVAQWFGWPQVPRPLIGAAGKK